MTKKKKCSQCTRIEPKEETMKEFFFTIAWILSNYRRNDYDSDNDCDDVAFFVARRSMMATIKI
jgi:hypothetical protein